MTDEIKALNLNSDEESLQPEEAIKVDSAPTPVRSMPSGNGGEKKKKMIVMALLLVFLGMGSGYGLYSFKKPKAVKKLGNEVEGVVESGDTFGVMDEDAFRDTAEGEMTSGGIDGEGSHHLVREGGESKYVYLTSSVIDLDQFIGKSVKVWGETFEAQKAGWLMDVGRLEIL